MRFYIASGIKNKEEVQRIFERLTTAGHEITADWTLTDDIPEECRDESSEYVRSLAKRDFEGIRECEVFVLMSQPREGRSMYVELGVALSMLETSGRPHIFVIGPLNNESIFYYHPLVRRIGGMDELIEETKAFTPTPSQSKSPEGRLEEYRALRSEMLEIIKERVWGQATYAALSAATLGLMSDSGKGAALLFTMVLALPFFYHTMQREDARMRMGNYLRAVLEPKIPGMYWEEYLGLWRGKFGQKEGRGWLNPTDRAKHVFSFAGLYLIIPGFCCIYLYQETEDFVPRVAAAILLAIVVGLYILFFRLYKRGEAEYKELLRLGPKA